MTRRRGTADHGTSAGSRWRAWGVRVLVVAALAATLVLAGPKAWRVARAELRIEATAGAPVAVDRVGLVDAPDWARGAALRAVLRDLEPRLRGDVRMLDDEGARALSLRLQSSPWIRSARLERRFPDRFRVSLDLRRPVCRVMVGDQQVALLDQDAVLLPAGGESLELPEVKLPGPWVLDPAEFGRPADDARLVAAAHVVQEWRERILPAVPDAPELCEVDASNLGWRYVADPRVAEIVVVLRSAGSQTPATFQYGRAERDRSDITADVRAEVLRNVLAEFPGLVGIARGDLRFANLWREHLHPQPIAAGEPR